MEKYNGWTNRETWLVPLWFEDGLDHVVEDISTDSRDTWIRSASEALEEYFTEYVSEFLGAHETGIMADLLGGAAARINWYEIAEHMADEFCTPIEGTYVEICAERLNKKWRK